jgi:hypothetical protein
MLAMNPHLQITTLPVFVHSSITTCSPPQIQMRIAQFKFNHVTNKQKAILTKPSYFHKLFSGIWSTTFITFEHLTPQKPIYSTTTAMGDSGCSHAIVSTIWAFQMLKMGVFQSF